MFLSSFLFKYSQGKPIAAHQAALIKRGPVLLETHKLAERRLKLNTAYIVARVFIFSGVATFIDATSTPLK